MPQDALHVGQIARELRLALSGGKVNRITQADKEELTLYIYTEKKVVKLLLSTNASFARACLTENARTPLPVAPNFCMLLRKHLLGGEILDVRQVGFERIIEIDFFCQADFFAGKRTLVCELMGKYSNLILVEDGKILGALKTTSLEVSARILFPGALYAYPKAQDKLSPFDKEGIKEAETEFFAFRERTEDSVAEFLFERVVGLAPATAREMAKRCLGEDLSAFVSAFCGQTFKKGYILYDGEKAIDFFAFAVDGGKEYPDLQSAQDAYFSGRRKKKEIEGKRTRLQSALRAHEKKQRKHLQETVEKLISAQDAEENRKKGELLTANLYKLTRGMSEAEVDDYYTCKKVKIELDSTLPPAKNAQRYYKLYNKQKRAQEILTPRKEEIENALSYLGSVSFSLSMAQSTEDLEEIEREMEEWSPTAKKTGKKGEKERVSLPRKFLVDGFIVKAGKNNLQNERLYKECAPEDIWLHAQKYHSAHVYILTAGKKAPDSVLKKSAEICAYYSQAKGGEKIPVDYCEKKKVKKAPHAKAGRVYYNEYQTLIVTPDAHTESEVIE